MPSTNGVAAILLCVGLIASPFTARAQDITIIKNVAKTVTKTVNVNGNGNVVGGTVVVGSITNNNAGSGGNTGMPPFYGSDN
jgi:hypothetical protein